MIATNPAEGVRSIAKVQDGEDRQPFDAADLAKIFGVEREGAANHWLPYLALYTGARLHELGQLMKSDVRVLDGVPFLNIEANVAAGQRIKTKGSKRRVPVHPRLVELGFLDFAAGAGPLFPELHGDTAIWSSWWSRHLRRVVGITDERKVFHSFRHSFVDAAREVMGDDQRRALTGHSSGNVGDSYGRGASLKALAEAISKIRFDI
jgi:integrase